MPKQPALFLDRDGVFIENRANYVRSWEDVEFFPQALAALARIREIPYKIIVVTNQSAVGRGILSLETAVSLNDRILAVVREGNGRIDASYLCPAKPGTNDPCRKPRPGMLLQAAQEHNLDLSQSYMIGDALTDIQAGQAAGVKQAILLLTGRGAAQAQLPLAHELPQFGTFATLAAALNHLFPQQA
ncbi:MAG: HAD family hydrolase [Anaerolineales bacterium]|nr:HAD family hydrolase [Anaerolineales bacterium]